MHPKLRELLDELRTVVIGERKLLDTLLPPLLFFLLIARLSFTTAVWGALGLAAAIIGWRLARRQSVAAAAGGVLGLLLAAGVARLLDREAGFFLPSIAVSGGTVVLAAVSMVVRRPMVAWTSHIARRWPRAWYWHPRVRPAYTEVTGLWLVYFLARFLLQVNLFQAQQLEGLAGVNLALGWPGTVALLVVSYLYGTWRLGQLGGPSVAEFEAGADPPWESQRRGF